MYLFVALFHTFNIKIYVAKIKNNNNTKYKLTKEVQKLTHTYETIINNIN